jgi:preprotein translocase subunit YajC
LHKQTAVAGPHRQHVDFKFSIRQKKETNTVDGFDGLSGSILYFVLIAFIFYFFLIRPQSKKQKERQRMLDALKKGDNIVTLGGLHGKVVGFKSDDKILLVEIASGVKVYLDRSAVSVIKGEDSVKESQ